MAHPAPEPGAEQEAEEGGRQEAAFVGVDLPDVHQEEQGHAECADGDQRCARPGEGKDQQERQDDGEGDAERGLGPVREMGEERRHHRESKDRLVGKGGVRVQPLRGARSPVWTRCAPQAPQNRASGTTDIAIRTHHRRQDRKVRRRRGHVAVARVTHVRISRLSGPGRGCRRWESPGRSPCRSRVWRRRSRFRRP